MILCVVLRWIPETGGANVPALNDLLSMYQVSLKLLPYIYAYILFTIIHVFKNVSIKSLYIFPENLLKVFYYS